VARVTHENPLTKFRSREALFANERVPSEMEYKPKEKLTDLAVVPTAEARI